MRIFALSTWLMLGLSAFSQGPITDRIVVDLPTTTWVGSHALPPGKYTIRQLPTASHPRLLEFSSDSGTKLETAITTIADISNNVRRDTSVVVSKRGAQARLTHVWVAGKTYGYEIPGDDSKLTVATAEKVTLAANYFPAEQEVAAAPKPAPPPEPEPVRVAQAQPQPAPAPEPTPQATPAPVPAPEPAPQAAVAAQAPALPETASNWAEIALAGFVFLALGLFLLHPTRNA